MAQSNDPNLKHYFNEYSFSEFVALMAKHLSAKEIKPVTIWLKGEEEEKAELYLPWDFVEEEKRLKLKPTGSLVTKLAGSNKADKDVFVKIPIDKHTHVFTISKLIFHSGELTYSLIIGNIIYVSKKRSSFRLNSSEVIPIQFKIDGQVFDALDISIGGTSFLLKEEEKSRFVKDQIFKECIIRFDRKNYHIPTVRIAGIFQNETTVKGFIKIGISFIDLHEKIEDELYVKITTEARGEEMKKKFNTLLNKKDENKAG